MALVQNMYLIKMTTIIHIAKDGDASGKGMRLKAS